MPNKFYIEHFEPKYLRKAHKSLERHLEEVQIKLNANESYRDTFSKKKSLWEKIKESLHLG
jgi:hypothetical protein